MAQRSERWQFLDHRTGRLCGRGTMHVVPLVRWSGRRVALLMLAAGWLGLAGLARGADARKPAPTPEPAKTTEFSGTSLIDAGIKEAWDAAKIKPSKECTDEEYLRRAYLDLLGR